MKNLKQAGSPMSFQGVCRRGIALRAAVASPLIAVWCFVRGLSLCFSSRPKTPLRVLCIVAFDTLHMLRNAKPLPRRKLRVLAALLDFGACANAILDGKNWRRREWRETLQIVQEAGLRAPAAQYLERLEDLERSRPPGGGGSRQFQEVCAYREAVVRLSLGMLAVAADLDFCLTAGIHAIDCDTDLNILFRIAMLCQIIDDVLDYSQDVSAGLPSFLTATRSLPQALLLTGLASSHYAADVGLPQRRGALPLRLALFLTSLLAKAIFVLGRPRLEAELMPLINDFPSPLELV
jgi:hypothetical protein